MSLPALRVLTHGGAFHADDVMAVAAVMLATAGPVEVRRSRNPDDCDWADVVLDVGGNLCVDRTRSPAKYWLDHHQTGGAGHRPDGVPYAAAGLAWKYFGAAATERVLSDTRPAGDVVTSVRWAADRVDRYLVAPIDAADCGYDLSTGWKSTTKIRPCLLSAVIGSMNTPWDEDPRPEAFDAAVDLAVTVYKAAIARAAADFRALDIVSSAYATRKRPELMALGRGCPWKTALIEELKDREVLYVIYPESGTGWMVQAVPTPVPDSFAMRKPLPAPWSGLRDGAFQQVTGVADAVFCHPNRFICGARSFTGAEALAAYALAAA